MKAAFPDQRTGSLTAHELLALQTLGAAGPRPLMAQEAFDSPGCGLYRGLEALRLRGWVRLRDWPRLTRTRWEMTPRGLREAVVHPDLNGWRAWWRALVHWLRRGNA